MNDERQTEFRSLILYSVIALGLAFGIRFFIAAPYLVEGTSMDPTFHTNDYLIIDRLSYRLHDPERGDVIVFRYPEDPSRSFIKRVIGLPGETVVIKDQKVSISSAARPDGFTLNEPYIATENLAENDLRVIVPENAYFVLGDNRRASADSRLWGMLPRDNIIGRALVRLYPFTNVGIMPGSMKYQGE